MAWVCLMYHDVTGETPGRGGGGPERFSVSTASFEEMLDTILECGYQGCSIADALRRPDVPRVGISFDDGTRAQLDNAVPALRDRGMTATFFVVTDWVDKPGYMEWDELRQLTDWGMSVQSHSKSHPHLSELDASALKIELAESKAILDGELEQETDQIGLPKGNAPRFGLRHLLAESGYAVVANSRWGRNSDKRSNRSTGVQWIRRCTVPPSLAGGLGRRIVVGDRRLTALHYSREAALNGLRAVLGAGRYARWRRRVLDTLRP